MLRQDKNKVYRVVDANVNRLKEGIRVCEDIVRFFIEDSRLWLKFKKIRQEIFSVVRRLGSRYELLKTRDIAKDIGKKSIGLELKRRNYQEIFYANLQRSKESLRVLEEFSKIINKKFSSEFKKIRYQIYELEKIASKKIKK